MRWDRQAARFPTVLIAGAPKCGTSSLFNWLCAHPEVQGSVPKEPRVLLDLDHPWAVPSANFNTSGVEAYARVFPEVVVGGHLVDGTPEYLYQATPLRAALEQIHPPSIVFCLRDPAERLLSLYSFARGNVGTLDPGTSFADVVVALLDDRSGSALSRNWRLAHGLEHGRYATHLRPWAARYDRSRIRFVLLDDMRRRPDDVMADLASWLGIDPDGFAGLAHVVANRSVGVRSAGLRRLAKRGANLLGQGRARHLARDLYWRTNARPGPAVTEEVSEPMARLRAHFADGNAELAATWGVDVAEWAVA